MNEQTPSVPWVVKIVPPVWILIFLGLGLGAHWLFPSRSFMDWRSYPVAIVLFVSGLSCVLWSASIFRRRGTEIEPASPSNKLLLVEGPYTMSRNPIYLGMTLALFGIAFFVGTLPMFLVPVVFFCLMHFVFVPFEEAKMLRQFGERYAELKRRIRRWV